MVKQWGVQGDSVKGDQIRAGGKKSVGGKGCSAGGGGTGQTGGMAGACCPGSRRRGKGLGAHEINLEQKRGERNENATRVLEGRAAKLEGGGDKKIG